MVECCHAASKLVNTFVLPRERDLRICNNSAELIAPPRGRKRDGKRHFPGTALPLARRNTYAPGTQACRSTRPAVGRGNADRRAPTGRDAARRAGAPLRPPKARFQEIYDTAQEKTAADFDHALDRACETLVTAGDLTAESAERLRQFLRRDLLQRDHPDMTFRSGDITTGGTLTCEGCNWTIIADRTTLLPLCPQCGETSFRKAA